MTRHTHANIYIYIYIYTYTHTHTHTHKFVCLNPTPKYRTINQQQTTNNKRQVCLRPQAEGDEPRAHEGQGRPEEGDISHIYIYI